MISVVVKRTCAFPAAKAWNLLSDFGNLSWAPGMSDVSCEGSGVGMIRKIALKGRAPAIESLDSLDVDNMRFTYSVVEGNPMPIAGLRGDVHIRPAGSDCCVIEWRSSAASATVGDDDANAMLVKFYERTLDLVCAHLDESGGSGSSR